MLKKVLSMCAAVALILLGVSPLTSSAISDSYQIPAEANAEYIAEKYPDYPYYLSLYVIDSADRSSVWTFLSSTDDVTYTLPGSASFVSALCVETHIDTLGRAGSTVYNMGRFTVSNYSEYTYMSAGGYKFYTAGYTGDISNMLESVVTNMSIDLGYSGFDTNLYFGDDIYTFPAGTGLGTAIYKVYNSEDPTETTTTGSGSGFQLPDAWINGGETLAPAEPVTFETQVAMSDAVAELESMEYTTPPDVLGAVGAFWFIFDGFVKATDLMWLVITSLVVVLVAWFLGRRV